jgi:hypothetical protein
MEFDVICQKIYCWYEREILMGVQGEELNILFIQNLYKYNSWVIKK